MKMNFVISVYREYKICKTPYQENSQKVTFEVHLLPQTNFSLKKNITTIKKTQS